VAEYGQAGAKLGQGSFGVVYKTNKGYAIKCMIDASKAADIRDADLRELVLLRNLIHPNVIQVKQVAIANSVAFPSSKCYVAAVLPLATGTLNCIAPLFKQNASFRAFVMYQFLRAVAYVHSRGVFHRDIKPGNVLWNESTMTLKLADFGAAQGLTVPRGKYSNFVTTYIYQAPELFLGLQQYQASADVWSVGASWLELVGYKALYNGDQTLGDRLHRAFAINGYPVNQVASLWPNVLATPKWSDWLAYERTAKPLIVNLDKTLSGKLALSAQEIDAIKELVQLDPDTRASAQQTLQHMFFDGVRAFVKHSVPAPPLPSQSLVGCGDVLLALELPPVGDYLAAQERREEYKTTLIDLFEWMYRINNSQHNAMSTVILAVAIFHRFAAYNAAHGIIAWEQLFADNNLSIYGITCLMIASKLDADGTAKVFTANQVVQLTKNRYSKQQIVDAEREILTWLDMDLDRPTAATFLHYFVGDGEEVIDDDWQMLWYSCVQQYDVCTAFRGSQMAVAVHEQFTSDVRSLCIMQTRVTLPDMFAVLPDITANTAEAFRIAVRGNNEKVVKQLLECCTDAFHIDDTNALGQTALHIAAFTGRHTMVELLAKSGADVNKPQHANNTTPLMAAVRRGYLQVVEVLLRYGADIAAVDSAGSTALRIAKAKQHDNIVALLMQHRAPRVTSKRV
jgi:serine/threonine protein kinase